MDAADLQREAAEHVRKGRFAKAIDLYRQALSEAPDDPELRAHLANAYQLDKNPERAFHHFKRSAAVYASREDMPAALQMLQAANAVAPGEPDIIHRIAESCQSLGLVADFEAALVALIKAATAKGDRRRVWALEELHRRYPDDLAIAERRAESLAETGRLDEAIDGYKKLSARLIQKPNEFVAVLLRAATASIDRADIGADICQVLLAHQRPKDALAALLPFYERHNDSVPVLEALLSCLEQLGAAQKALAARIELLKARALHSMRSEAKRDIDALLQLAPDRPDVLEVCAHAANVIGEVPLASRLWRELATVAGQRGLRLERDRAILSLLKANPDDEEALELGASALAEAGRAEEAATLQQQLARVRATKKQAARKTRDTKPDPRFESDHRQPTAPEHRGGIETAPHTEPQQPVAGRYATAEPKATATGTMVLDEDDVLEIHSDEPIEVDISLSDEPVETNPWGTAAAVSAIDMDEDTSEDLSEFIESLETRSRDAIDPPTGSAPIQPEEFGPEPGMGSDDITTIGPNGVVAAETDNEPNPMHRKSTVGRKAHPLEAIDPEPSDGGLVDPFFAEEPLREDDGAHGDDITSRMAALVAEETRLRAASGVHPMTPFDEPLVADLLEEAELGPKR